MSQKVAVIEDDEVILRGLVDNHMASLRLKLEKNPEKPRHLLTVHGVGYRLVT